MKRSAMLLLLALGCSSNETPSSPGLRTFPVVGKVTHLGQPLSGVDVRFISDDGSITSFAKTDAAGAFKLSTYADGDGAPARKYYVVVTDPNGEPGTKKLPGEDGETIPMLGRVPAKYSSAATSPLTAVVTEAGPNAIDLKVD
jgi:hypothetical protein